MKDSSIEGLSSNDKNHNEDGEVVPSTLSDSTLRNLVDFKSSKMKELIPGLTDFRIKKARKHCIQHGSGVATSAAAIYRFSLNETQVEHFLRFITSDVIS